MMKVTLCVLLIAGLSGVLAGPVIKKRAGRRDYCHTSYGVFRHGQVFKMARYSCLQYRCEFGRARVYEIGCPHEGLCHHIGSTWSASDCHTYYCNKRSPNSYDIQRLRSGCRDASGRCRRPGERFRHHVQGRTYDHCTCITTSNAVSYRCNQKRRGTQ